MINCKIKLYSKTKESILQFIKLLQHSNTFVKQLKFNFHLSKVKKERKRIAILKSPHVNKKAQEHYQIIVYTATINYFSWETYKSIFFIKKIKNFMFSGLKLKIEKSIRSNKDILQKKLIDIRNKTPYEVFLYKQQQKLAIPTKPIQNTKLLIQTLQYLKNLDTYGFLVKKIK